jgi:hypothetical protein
MSYVGEDPTYEERLQKEFEGMLPRAEGWVEAFVQDLTIQLPLTRDIQRKYLWTSPVFWAEKTINWSVVKGSLIWLQHRKVGAIIVASISLIAAVLTILSWIGLLSPLD